MTALLKKALSTRLSAFAVVGTIGFIVDATVLKLYLISVENDPILGRAVSFPIAVTVTWLLNRQFTFSQGAKKYSSLFGEWSSYLLVNAFGFIINLCVFMLVIFTIDTAKLHPIFTLGFASLIAMFFNYFGSKHWVFRVR